MAPAPAGAAGPPAPATVTGPPATSPLHALPPTSRPPRLAHATPADADAPDGTSGGPARAADGPTGVVVLAAGSDTFRVRSLCRRAGVLVPIADALPADRPDLAAIVIGDVDPPPPDRLAYQVPPTLTDDMLIALLRARVTGRAVVEPPRSDDARPEVVRAAQRIVAARDRGELEAAARDALVELVAAERSYVLFHEPATGALWSERARRAGARDARATAGIVGWCAQTGDAVHAPLAGDDPRFRIELDDPTDGKPKSRMAVQPVLGADRRVHALLVAVRRWRQSDFDAEDLRTLRELAARIAPRIDPAAVAAVPAAVATTANDGATPATPPPAIVDAVAAASASGRVRRPSAPPGAPRARTTSEPPGRARRASGAPEEPHDLALIAANAEDVPHLERMVRKARLEVSVLTRIADVPPYYRIVTLDHPWTPESDARIAYAARGGLPDPQLIELLAGLASDRAREPLVVSRPQTASEARQLQLAYARSRAIAHAADLVEAETLTVAAVRALLDTDRAYFLYFDPSTGALWSEQRLQAQGDHRRAIAGISGWAARTGRAVSVPRASADPRWLGPLDDPDGEPNSQLLMQPVIAPDRTVIGVVVAARRPRRAGFSDHDAATLALFATFAAPLLEQLALAVTTRVAHRDSVDDVTAAAQDARAIESPLQTAARRLRALPPWSWAIGGALVAAISMKLGGC